MEQENQVVQYNQENYKKAWVQHFANNFVEKGLSTTQIGFLFLHDFKSKVIKVLTEKELEAQKILMDAGTTEITLIEESLERYRKHFSDVDENIRKMYTSHIKEKLIDPATAITKRIDYSNNPEYIKLNSILFSLKKEYENKQRAAQEKEREKNAYISHVKNETVKRIAEYRSAVLKELNTMYSFFLQNKEEKPDVQAVTDAIVRIQVRPAVKYVRNLISNEEASEIVKELFKTFPDVDKEALKAESLDLIDSKFRLYENDLAQIKNKPEIISEIKSIGEREIETINQTAELTTSVNSMVASSENKIEFVPDFKPIKKKLAVVNENSEQWHINVIAAYLRTPGVRNHLRARKNWGTLDVNTMAAALGDFATENPETNKIDTLKYEEIEK